jgi:hypothetical protein
MVIAAIPARPSVAEISKESAALARRRRHARWVSSRRRRGQMLKKREKILSPSVAGYDPRRSWFGQHQPLGSMNFHGPNSVKASITCSWLKPIPAAISLLYFSIKSRTACSFRFMSGSASIG